MWTIVKGRRVRVVGNNELDMRRVVKPGDRVSFLSRHSERKTFPAVVTKVYRYFAELKYFTKGGRVMTESANWWDICGHNGKESGYIIYKEIIALDAEIDKQREKMEEAKRQERIKKKLGKTS